MNTKTKYLVVALALAVVSGTLYFGSNNGLFTGNAFKVARLSLETCTKLRQEGVLNAEHPRFEACKKIFDAKGGRGIADGTNKEEAPATTPTAYETGTLTTATKSSQVASHIVIAGRQGVEFGRFEFAATTEDIMVQDLTFLYISSSQGGSDEIQKIYLFDANDLNTPLNNGYVQNGEVKFQNTNFVVPADSKSVLVLAADLSTISQGADSGSAIAFGLKSVDKAQGKNSGQNIAVNTSHYITCSTILNSASTSTDLSLSSPCSEISIGDIVFIDDVNDEYVLVLNKDTNNDGIETDYTVVKSISRANNTHTNLHLSSSRSAILNSRGNHMVVRKTMPTFSTLSNSNGVKLANGADQSIYKFSVQAEAEEEVDLNTLVFTVTGRIGGKVLSKSADAADGVATDGSDGLAVAGSDDLTPTVVVTGVQLYDATDGEYVANANIRYLNDYNSTGYIVVTFANSEEVSASGRTYELRATISDVGLDGDFLSVLINDTAVNGRRVVTDTAANIANSNWLTAGSPYIFTDVVWSDEAIVSHSTGTADFTNAYLLRSLKTVAQTMTL